MFCFRVNFKFLNFSKLGPKLVLPWGIFLLWLTLPIHALCSFFSNKNSTVFKMNFSKLISSLRFQFMMLFAVFLIANQTVAFDIHRRMLMDSASGEELGTEGAKRNWNNAAVGLWGKRSAPTFYDSEVSLTNIKIVEFWCPISIFLWINITQGY